MSDKHYVGLDIMEFENTGKHKPISRVTLFVDDEQSYTAGDDTGKEVSAFCPSATQAMADALLAQLRGYEYQSYSAGDANIDPAAELGDGVTVGGIYSVISQIDDDGSGYAGIAAPGEAEMEEEYPYVGPLEREFNRKMHVAYSLIEKNNQRITLEVGELKSYTDGALKELEKEFGNALSDLEGDISVELEKYSTIEMTSSSISAAVSESKIYTDSKTGEVVASLKNYSTIEQTNSSISAAVTSVKEYTNSSVNSLGSSIDTKLENYSTIEMTDSKISAAVSESKTYTDSKTGQISSQLSNYSTIEQTANSISTAVSESKSYTDQKTGAITSSLSNYSTIEQTANSISAAVTESKQYADGRYESLSSTWEQTAAGFRADINGLNGKYTSIEATVNGFTVTDSGGTTLIKGDRVETGSLVLTGVITWSDLDSGVQSNINNRGISAAAAKTLITSTLVSSPTIRGGSFEDLNGLTKLTLDPTSGGYADLHLTNQNGQVAFSINDNIGSATLKLYGMGVLTAGIMATFPLGTWDFSNTEVIGLTPVFA